MRLQAITLIAVFSGIITSTSADAGKFNLGDVIRTAQRVDRIVNGPQHGGGPGPIVKPLPHPGHGGKPPGFKPKPPVCKPPVHLPTPPPVYHPPIHKPQPPVCKPKPPVCPPPVYKPIPKPPVCPPPVHKCPKCHSKVCHCHKPPINRPPVKCYTMKLINDAGAEVFFSLNGQDYQQLDIGDFEMVKSRSRKPHLISYHNGLEVVEFELDPAAVYGFEWQGDILMLLEIQG